MPYWDDGAEALHFWPGDVCCHCPWFIPQREHGLDARHSPCEVLRLVLRHPGLDLTVHQCPRSLHLGNGPRPRPEYPTTPERIDAAAHERRTP